MEPIFACRLCDEGSGLGGLAASAFVLSLLVYIGVILWLDNVHIGTSNGMYKAI